MKLNHINLVVTNVAEVIHLFQTCFGFSVAEIKGDNIVAVLKGTDGFTLVLMVDKDQIVAYPKAFHIGFMQDNIEAVNEMHEKLKTFGADVGDQPKKIRDSFGFYFTFQNIMIEVGHYIEADQI
ncbi:MAG: VOC family protein [Bacteroidota bacterium]